jgi:hypothetical protein
MVHVEEKDEYVGFAVHVPLNGIEDPEGWQAELVHPNQVRLQLGYNVWPGLYTIRVGDGSNLFSKFVPYEIFFWRFRVIFESFSCADEGRTQ